MLELFIAQGGPQVVGTLVGVLIGLALGILIGAVLLRAGCHFARVQVPEFGKACGIVVIVMIANWVVNFALGFAIGLAVGASGGELDSAMLLSIQGLGIVVSFFIASLIYKAMIPTETFGRAALVWLIQVLIALAIALVVVAIVFAVGSVM